MNGVLTPTPTHRKRWTREDCAFLERSGLLTGKWELLDGEIVVTMPQNYPHANAVSFLLAYCLSLVGPARVRTQATMEIHEADQSLNRPEPDLVILREPVRRIPLASDVLLVAEVSDSTQADDFGHKAILYARAGIPEYWVLDVPRELLVSFRQPESGEYTQRIEHHASDSAMPLFTDQAVLVSTLLP